MEECTYLWSWRAVGGAGLRDTRVVPSPSHSWRRYPWRAYHISISGEEYVLREEVIGETGDSREAARSEGDEDEYQAVISFSFPMLTRSRANSLRSFLPLFIKPSAPDDPT
ncbi:hypothetical protein XA68_17692 [Ophiocordyceps unilateralis]|uniref:Uncharacterized protein n=1 Tax=Ophiocordyceps unilateralis TaxID=268505 RepID=A0A2A9P3I8_OPHUN|nr:hypothetical protein XA68_17692 [Ophiocordyceps unilateralis]